MTTESRSSYRTVFISDLHLGSPHCQADRLLAFLKRIEFETLVLVGDVFDSPRMTLPEHHKEVLALIAARMRAGVQVIFVPGNHDRVFRDLCGTYGQLTVMWFYTHTTRDHKRILVMHGDEWDRVGSFWLMHLIDRRLPFTFWEIVRKLFVGFMRRHLVAFEAKALAARDGHDRILCGHVHFPTMRDGYLNCGDWIKHCSAIVEHDDGRLELVYG